jgi:hypothetical protein
MRVSVFFPCRRHGWCGICRHELLVLFIGFSSRTGFRFFFWDRRAFVLSSNEKAVAILFPLISCNYIVPVCCLTRKNQIDLGWVKKDAEHTLADAVVGREDVPPFSGFFFCKLRCRCYEHASIIYLAVVNCLVMSTVRTTS